MKKYQIKDVVFTPNEVVKLTVDNQVVHMSKLKVQLFEYLLNDAKAIKARDEILKAVWGPGEHTYNAVQVAVSDLNKLLPADCKIVNIKGEGYVFDHDVTIVTYRFKKAEYLFEYSATFKRFLGAFIATIGMGIFAAASYGFTLLYFEINPLVYYGLINDKAHFARDYVIGTPQLSPDKRFLAHRATRNIFVDDHLALLDLQYGDTRPIIPMGFLDGYKWNLAGDKIVYQKTTASGECQIRLLSFHNPRKTDYSDKQLTTCDENSGQLSFAWFSEHEFYANFVADDAEPTANNLPFHHLYTFNIKTGDKRRIKSADYQGDFGFYSLEYDQATKRLHFLQTAHFKTTDFYYFDGTDAVKIDTIGQYVPFFAVANNKLIYKNKQKRFVINVPADNLTNPQEFLYPQLASLNKPHLMGDTLTYIAGETYATELHQLNDAQQLTAIQTQGFYPVELASYNHQLVFVAEQTGVEQVYMLNADNSISKISDMQTHQKILYVEITGNTFVLSYDNRVDVYQLQNPNMPTAKLHLMKSLPEFNRGVIHNSGNRLLLSYTNDNGQASIIEKELNDFTDTGRQVSNAKFAFYHNNDIVYYNRDKELIRLHDGFVIASKVEIELLEHTDVNGDDFYYIDLEAPKRPVTKLDLTTGQKSLISLGNVLPERIQAINGNLYISATKALKPTLITGEVASFK